MKKTLLICALFSILGCNRKLEETDLMSPNVRIDVSGGTNFLAYDLYVNLNIKDNKSLKNARLKIERADTGYYSTRYQIYQIDTTILASGNNLSQNLVFTKSNIPKAGNYRVTVNTSDNDGNSATKTKDIYIPGRFDNDFPYIEFNQVLGTELNFTTSSVINFIVDAKLRDLSSSIDAFEIDIERPFMNGNVLEMKSIKNIKHYYTNRIYENLTCIKSDFVDGETVYLAIRIVDEAGHISKYLHKLNVKF